MDDAVKPEPKVTLRFEVYQREDGWWSFRVNGEESHYRSSNEDGLNRTVRALLFGTPPGTVKLKALRAGAKETEGGASESVLDKKSSWADLPTQAERLKAFLTRGKLAEQESEKE